MNCLDHNGRNRVELSKSRFLSAVAYFDSAEIEWRTLIDSAQALVRIAFANSDGWLSVPGARHSGGKPAKAKRRKVTDPWDLSALGRGDFYAIGFWEPEVKTQSGWENLARQLWHIEVDAAPVNWGRPLPSFINVTLNTTKFNTDCVGAITPALMQFFAAASECGSPSSGFVDVSGLLETVGGFHYSARGQESSFVRKVMRRVWASRTNCGHCFETVHWCHLLSSEMLDALGGEEFLAAYSALVKRVENVIVRFPRGYVALVLSDDLEEFINPQLLMPLTVDRAAWLHDRLREAQLLA